MYNRFTQRRNITGETRAKSTRLSRIQSTGSTNSQQGERNKRKQPWNREAQHSHNRIQSNASNTIISAEYRWGSNTNRRESENRKRIDTTNTDRLKEIAKNLRQLTRDIKLINIQSRGL